MNRWHNIIADELEDSAIFDPLCVERSAPMDDQEAEIVEALCHTATPGPLVIDDQVTGEGAVVVSLPDGRLIVSLTAPVEHTQYENVAQANAQLICKARYLLLRLLRDRHQWREERELLFERIRTLEAALNFEHKTAGQTVRGPSRPR